jgi:molybdate transport system ATP-binding protein
MSYLLKIQNATFRKFQHTVFPDVSWEIRPGESWAVVGGSGSGKTTFLEVLDGRIPKVEGEMSYGFTGKPSECIAAVYFNDPSVSGGDFYRQQRYNADETEGVVTVRGFLNPDDCDGFSELQALGLDRLLDVEIIKLSNGQLKKMMIAKALMKRPRLLLLDNLYTGLDKQSRDYIDLTVSRITAPGTGMVMVADRHIPDCVTNVVEIENMSVKSIYRRGDCIPARRCPLRRLPALPTAPDRAFETAVKLEDVNIVYNGRPVVSRAKWTVRHGDKWALTGPNGAGKSMLLSLVFADNPQAYSNSIILFDRKRGTGESIWDIKDNIGFVSPEMHLYFNSNRTCGDVALSGLSENPYRKTSITDEIVRFAASLFDYFAITGLYGEQFRRVSTGQQNVVLLIRALVKNPPMLVLDEPFQGMDDVSVCSAKTLLDEYCRCRTLIFVSHLPDELPSCIDRYCRIESGNLAF